MSTTVSVNGTNYNIPAYNDTGYAQGSGNLSAYLVALATAFLQTGGTNNVTGNTTLAAAIGFIFTTPDGTKTYLLNVDNNGNIQLTRQT